MYPAHSPCCSRLTSAWSKDGAEFEVTRSTPTPQLTSTAWRDQDLTAWTDGLYLMNLLLWMDLRANLCGGKLQQVRRTGAVSRQPPLNFPFRYVQRGAEITKEKHIPLEGLHAIARATPLRDFPSPLGKDPKVVTPQKGLRVPDE